MLLTQINFSVHEVEKNSLRVAFVMLTDLPFTPMANYGCTSEKHSPPINLKLTIPAYFEALITNMMMKIPANLIFEVKTQKNVFKHFFFI